ncbi:MAG: hypothetical protein U1F56_19390 [Rubrivivax sp.]
MSHRPAVHRPLRVAAPAAALLLAGCIVVPRTAEVYDPQCRTMVRQVVLETEVIGAIGGCRNDGCVVMLASMGIVSAASAVVSGSIAVVGNMLYWAERRGQCPPESAAAPAAPATPASGPPPVVPGLVPAPRGS